MTDRPPRVGVVGVPGGWSSEALADALHEATGYRQLIDMQQVVLDTATGAVRCGDLDLRQLEAIAIKKVGSRYSADMLDRLELLRFVAESGVRVFSDPIRIRRMFNRLSCTLSLRSAGIPMPPTVVTESVPRAVEAVAAFGAAVLKPLYSTKARGMRVIEAGTGTDLEAELGAFQADGNPVMYIQQKIEVPDRDLGVAFLGGEYLGTYARVRGEGAWNTTIRDGGRYEAHDLDDETIELARRAQAPFGLDFTSVDVALTDQGPVVFEVSAFGGFRGMRESHGVSVAERYAAYILARLSDD